MSLLVTAFGRFDGGPNCSERLLDRLRAKSASLEAAWRGPISFALIEVDTQAVESALGQAIADAAPSHVLMLGQAAGRDAVCIESLARNHRHLGVPDAQGRTGALGPVREGGAPELSASWPDLEAAAATMTAAGVSTRVSTDAGSHLCNQTLYLAIEAGGRAKKPFVATFLHLPLLPEQVVAGVPAAARLSGCFAMPLDDMARAVEAFLVHTRRNASSNARTARRS